MTGRRIAFLRQSLEGDVSRAGQCEKCRRWAADPIPAWVAGVHKVFCVECLARM